MRILCCLFKTNVLVVVTAGVDNLLSRQPTKVDFVPNTARPQPTAPPDLALEEFLSMDDVQTSPIPRSQLGHVIISYDKTIGQCLVFL